MKLSQMNYFFSHTYFTIQGRFSYFHWCHIITCMFFPHPPSSWLCFRNELHTNVMFLLSFKCCSCLHMSFRWDGFKLKILLSQFHPLFEVFSTAFRCRQTLYLNYSCINRFMFYSNHLIATDNLAWFWIYPRIFSHAGKMTIFVYICKAVHFFLVVHWSCFDFVDFQEVFIVASLVLHLTYASSFKEAFK